MVKKESAVAKKVQKSQIEEIVEQLLEKGRKSGVLTQSEISDALHEQTEITAEQLDDIYTTLGKLNALYTVHAMNGALSYGLMQALVPCIHRHS